MASSIVSISQSYLFLQSYRLANHLPLINSSKVLKKPEAHSLPVKTRFTSCQSSLSEPFVKVL